MKINTLLNLRPFFTALCGWEQRNPNMSGLMFAYADYIFNPLRD